MLSHMHDQRTLRGAIALAALLLGACSNESTAPVTGNRVSLGFQLARSSSSASLMSSSLASSVSANDAAANGGAQLLGATASLEVSASGLTIARQGDTIIVTRAQFVVSDVRLRSITGACTDEAASSMNSGKKNEVSECPQIRVGPFLVDVPVTGADGARLSVDVPAGTYGDVRMKLHKVEASNGQDLTFQQENPDFRGITARLEGTYNGTPFIFITDVTATLAVPLAKPLVIGTGGGDITVSVDIGSWFVRASGGLYSPTAANTPGQVRGAVNSNIERAFHAFRDQNHDGRED